MIQNPEDFLYQNIVKFLCYIDVKYHKLFLEWHVSNWKHRALPAEYFFKNDVQFCFNCRIDMITNNHCAIS